MYIEKTLESPLDYKEIQLVHSKGDQPWDFFGRTDAKAETPVLWPPHAKSWLIGKDSDAGRDWGQEEKGTTEDDMAGWHHWLDDELNWLNWTPGVANGQGGLAFCDSWGRKESDTTDRLIWSDLICLKCGTWVNFTTSCWFPSDWFPKKKSKYSDWRLQEGVWSVNVQGLPRGQGHGLGPAPPGLRRPMGRGYKDAHSNLPTMFPYLKLLKT